MEQMIGRRVGVDRGREVSVKIVVSDQHIKRNLFERIRVFFVLNEECFGSAVEDQGFRPFLKEEWMPWMA